MSGEMMVAVEIIPSWLIRLPRATFDAESSMLTCRQISASIRERSFIDAVKKKQGGSQ